MEQPDARARPQELMHLDDLSNSVETLANIFYLMQCHAENPETIVSLVAIAKPVVERLEEFIWQNAPARKGMDGE
jgi:hypothetical protein